MDINCKIKDNHATLHRPRESGNKEGSGGMPRSPWEGEISDFMSGLRVVGMGT